MTIDNETRKPIFCLSHVIKSADPKNNSANQFARELFPRFAKILDGRSMRAIFTHFLHVYNSHNGLRVFENSINTIFLII